MSWLNVPQLQVIGNNLYAPRSSEIMATYRFVILVFTMGLVLLLVMWALVVLIPCLYCVLQVHYPMSQTIFLVGQVILKILEESKIRERRNACGLMIEIHQIVKHTRLMNEWLNSLQYSMVEEDGKVRQAKELLVVYFFVFSIYF